MNKLLDIKEFASSEVKISFKNTGILDYKVGFELQEEAKPIIKTERDIIIDLEKITSINSDGFGFLKEIINIAAYKSCTISFTNINEEIDELIESLTFTNEG